MTNTAAKTIDMSAKVASPEALAACRAVYPDAKRATLNLPDGSRRGRDIVGSVITMGGRPVKILRATVAPIAASYGAMEDRDERGEYGYRATLIVSAVAAE